MSSSIRIRERTVEGLRKISISTFLLRSSCTALLIACGGGPSPADSGGGGHDGGHDQTDGGGTTDTDGGDLLDAHVATDAYVPCTLDETATPTPVGAMPNGVPATDNTEQAVFAVSEINNGCGMLGTATSGTPIALMLGNGTDADLGSTEAMMMIDRGAVWLSTQTISSASVRISDTSVDLGVPITSLGTVGSMTGCTQEQREDDAIMKIGDPTSAPNTCWDHHGLYFRTTPNLQQWSTAAIHQVLTRHPDARRMAMLYLDDVTGRAADQIAPAAFVDAGDGRTVTGHVPFAMGATPTDWAMLVQTLVADDPEVVVYFGRIANFITMIEAYVLLRDNTTDDFTPPAHYNNLAFVSIMGASAPGSWSSASEAARTVIGAQHVGVFPTWDTSAEGYLRWREAFLAYNPDGVITFANQGRFYDSTMILALATVAAGSTTGTEIAAHIGDVSSAPGVVVYPGEYARARALLLAGQDINYEGASGPCDIQETGDIASGLFEVHTINPASATGDPMILEVFAL